MLNFSYSLLVSGLPKKSLSVFVTHVALYREFKGDFRFQKPPSFIPNLVAIRTTEVLKSTSASQSPRTQKRQEAGCWEKYVAMIRGVESVPEVLVTAEPQEGRGNKRGKVKKGYAEETELGNSSLPS